VLVNALGTSSRRLAATGQTSPLAIATVWFAAYFAASAGGAALAIIKPYVEQQRQRRASPQKGEARALKIR
jgi:REP element-mobilizing transposase RayT